jgi:predicted ATPase/class 3 adenylate cyclase
MKCRYCKADNPDKRKYCRECGARLLLLCSECDYENVPGDKFCGGCGRHLRITEKGLSTDYSQPQTYTPEPLAEKILTARDSIEGERKLVTVLFADVVDYTSMSENLDPEEIHQIMEGCFRVLVDEIHRCEGAIDKFTGDGVMALFGAPLAHEDHAQRACHAALSIQKAIGEYGEKVRKDCGVEFRMRVGLNSGPVIVGTIGDDLRMDYTAIGDTTNLASRMESMAAPGTVRVSENTHRLARDYFQFQALGKLPVKGKEEPQEAYELVRPSEAETRIQAAAAKGLTRFVGRKSQLQTLREAFDQACSGSGQVLGIVGEAGVGKSRLLLELKNLLQDEEATCLEGRCLHFGGTMPYLPILDIVKSYFHIQEEEREYLIKKKLRERLSRLGAKLLTSLPSFHELLSLQVEEEKYLQVDPQQRRQQTFEAIRDLCIRESEVRPLVVAVEDLHWIDKTSQEFLDYLIGWLAKSRILLILLYRPEYTHTWGSKSYYTQIGLAQMSTRTSAELVQAVLEEGEVAPELRKLILGRAGGNPLFVEELTQSLLENGSIHREDDQYVLARKASEIQVPDTIHGIIAARIDRLEESLKRIMQVASVIGREFAYRILQTITGMREDLKGSLLNLQGLEFIYEKQLFPELEYIFKHALTQEVAYNSLLSKRRRELHGKIGLAIETIYANRLEEFYEFLAYHYTHSDNTAKAMEYLCLANQKAVTASATDAAKGYFDRAMELLDTLPDTEENIERRISLLVNQTNVFFLLLKTQEYQSLLRRYEPLLAKSKNQKLIGAFYSRLGFAEQFNGHVDQAYQTLARAAELCLGAGNAQDAGFSFMLWAHAHLWRADYERVLELKEDALRMMEESFVLRCYVRALTVASYACTELGRWKEAVKFGQQALSKAQQYSDNSLICYAEHSLSIAYTCKRDLDRAIRYGESAVARAQTPGDKVISQAFLAYARCQAGETRKGIEVLAGLLPVIQAARAIALELGVRSYLGDGYWIAGDGDKVRETAEGLRDFAKQFGAPYYLGQAHRLLGEVALNTDPEESSSHFEQAITILSEIRAENHLALAHAGYGRLSKRQGDMVQAREHLTRSLEIFERLGTLIEPDKVRRELAELPQPG